jgi:hypothetical protein
VAQSSNISNITAVVHTEGATKRIQSPVFAEVLTIMVEPASTAVVHASSATSHKKGKLKGQWGACNRALHSSAQHTSIISTDVVD